MILFLFTTELLLLLSMVYIYPLW